MTVPATLSVRLDDGTVVENITDVDDASVLAKPFMQGQEKEWGTPVCFPTSRIVLWWRP